nr:MAG TPA: hypothetical protein [Caudoviricetes sp.]
MKQKKTRSLDCDLVFCLMLIYGNHSRRLPFSSTCKLHVKSKMT